MNTEKINKIKAHLLVANHDESIIWLNEYLLKLQAEDKKVGVHFAHCNQGEYDNCCKYGDNDCPALVLKREKTLVGKMKSKIEEMDRYLEIDADSTRASINKLVKEAESFGLVVPVEKQVQNYYGALNQLEYEKSEAYANGWNDCRKEMLDSLPKHK